ncbi:helix-turn-helix domain-containing protein [Paenibacillus sp.]|uniref:helix-turn-helix domain-containing protein n=1 Tax=Paenibacillus sp. TaxID=58172 RepID=UPI002810A1AD|nr:helix-turn-helix domain-containing protein [Paenibacillus sp.]
MTNGISWFSRLYRWKRRTFLVKLILTTALIAVIPNLISDFIAYHKVSKTLEQETGNTKLQYLNQTINAMEIILGRIQENARQLALSRAFQDFESFPNGSYYESLQGELPKEDLPALYSYLEGKTNAFLTLNAFKLSNAFVDSVYFYDASKRLVMTSESDGSNRQFPIESFYDTAWLEALAVPEADPILMDTRVAKRFHSGEISVLSVIHKSEKGDNAVVVNLDASKMYSGIVNKLNDKDEIYVLSPKADLLFQSRRENVSPPTAQLIRESERLLGGTGSFVAEIGVGPKLVSYAASPQLQWTFVNVADMQALAKGTASIKQTILISAAALVLLSFTLAYLSSRRIYKPISRLSAIVQGRGESGPGGSDEIRDIGSFMESTMHERDFYKEKLEESLPFYREQFKTSLLHRHALRPEEIEEKKKYLGLTIDSCELTLMLLDWDNGDPVASEQEMIRSDLFRIRVTETIKQSNLIGRKHFLVDTDKNRLGIVLNCGETDRQYAFQLGQRLLDRVSSEFGIAFTIGMGRVCPTIGELPRAYDEAVEALKYRILFGKGDVISIEDIRNDAETEFVYPKEKEELLLSHMKTAREAEARQAFDDMMEDVVTRKNKLHYNQIQPIFMRLLTEMTTAFHQLGTDLRTACGLEADPYRELLNRDSLDAIHGWFHELIGQATAYIEREMNSKGNQHISKVIDILEREYARDLSLHSVAEQLNLNPAYISRLFKQITGQSFVDYLKCVRIERSKELLSRSGMKVNEIGRLVGYGNAYYFIKVFKEMIGLTPGEYKKLYGS